MQKIDAHYDYCRNMARSDDLERYYLSLFAPAACQKTFWAVLAFNQEVAKTRESVSDPMIGEIRLQWWREALDGISSGVPREHPVVQALADSGKFAASAPLLHEIIEGRAHDLYQGGPADIAALSDYANHVGGALSEVLLYILVDDVSEQARDAVRASGRAYAMLGLIRALPYQLMDGRDFSVLGATANQLASMPKEKIAEAVAPMLSEMTDYIATEIARSSEAVPLPSGIRPVLALNALTGLQYDALIRCKGDLFEFSRKESSNLRRLWALIRFHLFG